MSRWPGKFTGQFTGRFIGQFLRFASVGSIATALQYLLLILLVEYLLVPAWPASGLAFALSAIFNYAGNYHWSFASQAAHRQAIPRFILIAASSLGLTLALMYLLLPWMHYLLAQLLTTVTVLLWNFLAHRRWTFQAHREDQ